MNKKQYILILVIILVTFPTFAQESAPTLKSKPSKGKIYAFWGWNRGWYSDSDIQFTGDNYDFKLNDVHAQDRQSPFELGVYFGPTTITIPQTNLRVGYFINDKIDISIGVDHMKYIMPNNQTVEITGQINDDSKYDGNYSADDIELKSDFLFFEHSDGLNYINVEITRNDDLLNVINSGINADKLQIHTLIGFGLGGLMPRTNTHIWNNERHDEFHWAGYGFAAKVGLNVTFFKHFFIRTEYKYGFIDMPDVRTTPEPSDRASHHFFFRQLNFDFGYSFNPFK